MTNSIDIERSAATQHDIWSHWMKYQLSVCTEGLDGTLVIPSWAAKAWSRQASTPYGLLTEAERESDREVVRQFNVRLVGQKSHE